MTPRGGSGRRLLYLAFWYPPSRASGVYRALATSKSFSDAGWDVTVVTTNREFLEDEVGSIDSSLEMQIPDTVSVERVPFTFWQPPGRDLRSVGWLGATFPQVGNKLAARKEIDRYQRWIEPAAARCMDLLSSGRFDHILATGNPFSSFELARIVSEEIGVPYSVDYRDPWTLDVYTGAPLGGRSTIATEARVIESATACFHVNSAIAIAYEHKYPQWAGKHVVAPNGFDVESLGDHHHPNNAALNFGILGTITERWPIRAVVEAWKQSLTELPAGSQLLVAGHLGYFDKGSATLRHLLNTEGGQVEYLGALDKSEVADFYSRLDVVVVPVPGGDLVTSGKIYEALALGIPVVCVQEEGGGARALLADHPYAFAAHPTSESVRTAFADAATVAAKISPGEMAEIRESMMRHERSRAIRPILETLEASS